jgi:carbamoyltransferase
MGTDLDKLVIGNCYLEKSKQDQSLKKNYTKEFELD